MKNIIYLFLGFVFINSLDASSFLKTQFFQTWKERFLGGYQAYNTAIAHLDVNIERRKSKFFKDILKNFDLEKFIKDYLSEQFNINTIAAADNIRNNVDYFKKMFEMVDNYYDFQEYNKSDQNKIEENKEEIELIFKGRHNYYYQTLLNIINFSDKKTFDNDQLKKILIIIQKFKSELKNSKIESNLLKFFQRDGKVAISPIIEKQNEITKELNQKLYSIFEFLNLITIRFQDAKTDFRELNKEVEQNITLLFQKHFIEKMIENLESKKEENDKEIANATEKKTQEKSGLWNKTKFLLGKIKNYVTKESTLGIPEISPELTELETENISIDSALKELQSNKSDKEKIAYLNNLFKLQATTIVTENDSDPQEIFKKEKLSLQEVYKIDNPIIISQDISSTLIEYEEISKNIGNFTNFLNRYNQPIVIKNNTDDSLEENITKLESIMKEFMSKIIHNKYILSHKEIQLKMKTYLQEYIKLFEQFADQIPFKQLLDKNININTLFNNSDEEKLHILTLASMTQDIPKEQERIINEIAKNMQEKFITLVKNDNQKKENINLEDNHYQDFFLRSINNFTEHRHCGISNKEKCNKNDPSMPCQMMKNKKTNKDKIAYLFEYVSSPLHDFEKYRKEDLSFDRSSLLKEVNTKKNDDTFLNQFTKTINTVKQKLTRLKKNLSKPTKSTNELEKLKKQIQELKTKIQLYEKENKEFFEKIYNCLAVSLALNILNPHQKNFVYRFLRYVKSSITQIASSTFNSIKNIKIPFRKKKEETVGIVKSA